MSVLSERLKELRGPQSQAKMAEPLGIVYQQWAKYERGESAPGSELLAKICRVHACSADWLLGLDKPKATSVTVNGSGNAVATGAHAVAIAGSSSAPGKFAACSKCPYRAAVTKLQRAGLKVPGLDG